MRECLDEFIQHSAQYDFPIHRPYYQLSDKEKALLWDGDGKELWGIHQFFDYLEGQRHKVQNRIMLSRFKGKTTCPTCHGKRLRQEADVPFQTLWTFPSPNYKHF